jgi:hypothetical protein
MVLDRIAFWKGVEIRVSSDGVASSAGSSS